MLKQAETGPRFFSVRASRRHKSIRRKHPDLASAMTAAAKIAATRREPVTVLESRLTVEVGRDGTPVWSDARPAS